MKLDLYKESKMDELADRIEVQDVMLRYAATVDEKDYEGYKALFTENVKVVGFGSEEINGIDDYFSWWKDALDKYDATQHMLSPTYAVINGDSAKTRTDVQALHYPNGEKELTLTLWATYHTDMLRVGGVWKISRHELVRRGIKQQP